jgi:sugar-specific transcriptional regulator TrmB
MTDVTHLIDDATAKLRAAAQELRTEIEQKERELEDELAPLRLQLAELDEAIARIKGKRGRAPAKQSDRAPRGRNRQLILDFLSRNPGARPTEVAEATTIRKPTVYATLAKLVQDGLVVRTDEADGVRYARKAEKKP